MSQWRTARVFISSTFRDMHAERDHLVHSVFPKLRQRLERHRIYVEDIDLRWGITLEQVENKDTLDLCLRTIDECRPFFLGLLGERYGAILGPAGKSATQDQRSVTELEIMHGVFNAQAQGRALFFFRDPAFLARAPKGVRKDFTTGDAASRKRLEDLKRRIRQSGHPVVENYPCAWRGDAKRGGIAGLEEFGRQAYDGLLKAISQEFALGEQDASRPDAPADEADLHLQFMEARTRVFSGRRQQLSALHDFMASAGSLCVVSGPSGIGKSALLARFGLDLGNASSGIKIGAHFVGAGERSSDLQALLARFTALLAGAPGSAGASSLAETKVRFERALTEASPDQPVVLIIDAVDQLGASAQAAVLDWLPATWPAHVRIIVSCVSDAERGAQVLEALRLRKAVWVQVPALNDGERAQMIRDVPSLAAKMLDKRQIALLSANTATSNPLFLRVALEELRTFGLYDKVSQRIQQFPHPKKGKQHELANSAGLTRLLFAQVLERLEAQYGRAAVATVVGSIVASRRGLFEHELAALVGDAQGQAETAQGIVRQLRPYLFASRGALTFLHIDIGAASETRYLAGEARFEAHTKLARFFRRKDWRAFRKELGAEDARDYARACEEAPWQLLAARRYDEAAALLLTPAFMETKAACGQLADLIDDFRRCLAATQAVPIEDARIRRQLRAQSQMLDEIVGFPRRKLAAVEEALQRDRAVLLAHPETLLQSLWNAAWWIDGVKNDAYWDWEHIAKQHRGWDPETAEIEGPGATLLNPDYHKTAGMAEWLEQWREDRRQSGGAGPMLRSLRPPAQPLGVGGTIISANVEAFALAPQRRRLVTAGGARVQVWDADTGDELRRIELDAYVQAMSADLKARHIAVADGSQRICIFDGETGARVLDFAPDGMRADQMEAVVCATHELGAEFMGQKLLVAVSHDGALAAAAYSGTTTITIWDLAHNVKLHRVENPNPIRELNFALGAVLNVGDYRRLGDDLRALYTTQLWDAGGGKMLQEIPLEFALYAHGGERALMSLPGGAIEGSGGNTDVYVYDKSGRNPTRLKHQKPIRLPPFHKPVIAFSERGDWLAVAEYTKRDPAVAVYDAKTGVLVDSFWPGHDDYIEHVGFITDQDADRIHRLWTDDPKRIMQQMVEASGSKVELSEWGTPLIVTASKDGTARIRPLSVKAIQTAWPNYNISNQALVRETQQHWTRWALAHAWDIRAIGFSHDGSRLVSTSSDATMIWRTEDGTWARQPDPGAACIQCFAKRPSYVRVGAAAQKVEVVSINDGTVEASRDVEGSELQAVAVSQDGDTIVVGDDEGRLVVLDGARLDLRAQLNLGSSIVGLDIHPEGSVVVATTEAGEAVLVDLASGKERNRFSVSGAPMSRDEILALLSQQTGGHPTHKFAHTLLLNPKGHNARAVFAFGGALIAAPDNVRRKTSVWTWDGEEMQTINALMDGSALGDGGRPFYPFYTSTTTRKLDIGAGPNTLGVAFPVPGAVETIATHPNGRIFALSCQRHLLLLRLEDAPDVVPADAAQAPAAPHAIDEEANALLAEGCRKEDAARELWRTGEAGAALGEARAALSLYQRAGGALDARLDQALCQMLAARILHSIGDVDAALAAAEAATAPVSQLSEADLTTHALDIASFAFEFSNWLDRSGRYERALAINTVALSFYRAFNAAGGGEEEMLALAILNQGYRLLSVQRDQEALESLQDAEARLQSINPAGENLALCRVHKATALERLGQGDEAVASLDAAIRDRARGASDDAQAGALEYALIRVELLSRLHPGEAEISALEQAFALASALGGSGPVVRRAELRLKLAGKLSAAGRKVQALTCADAAVDGLRAEPAGAPILEWALRQQGVLLVDLEQDKRGLKTLEEAWSILAPPNAPHAFRVLAGLHDYRALALSRLGRGSEALEAARLGHEATVQACAGLPPVEEFGALWQSLIRQRQFADAAQDAGARLAVETSLIELCDVLHARDAASWQKVTEGLGALADAKLAGGDVDAAFGLHEKRIAILRGLPATEAEANLPMLANMLYVAGDIKGSHKRHEEALASLTEAVAINRRRGDAEARIALADCLYLVSTNSNDLGRYEDAIHPSQEAISIRRSLVAGDRSQVPALEAGLTTLAWSLFNLGRLDEAQRATEEAAALDDEVLALDPAAYALQIASSLDMRAMIANGLGRRHEAIDLFSRALAMLSDANDPGSAELRGLIDKELKTLTASV